MMKRRTRPAVLRSAIGAVKDQTSIGLAQVFSASASPNLDVAVLKATSHDEVPVDDRHVDEVLILASCSRAHAAACVSAIAARLARTRSWVVALKCLALASRAIADAGPSFLREVAAASRRGVRLLDLSWFRQDLLPLRPREHAAFVRSFALYLDERLDCILSGKLDGARLHAMRPPAILDRVAAWQRALERAVATRPAGAAMGHRLVQIALYSVVTESFELYRGVSDGLAVVLGGFFDLQPWMCVGTYRACAKAAKQFEELEAFYALCVSIGVGRPSQYPAVEKISGANLETFSELLRANKATAAMAGTASDPSPSHRPDMRGANPQPPAAAATPETGPSTDLASSSKEKSNRGENSRVAEPRPPAKQPEISTPGAEDEWERLLAESATTISKRSLRHSFSEAFEPTAAPFSYGRASVCVPAQEYINPFLLDGAGEQGGASMALVAQPEADALLLATNSVLQTVDSTAVPQILQQEQHMCGCSSMARFPQVTSHHDLALL